MKQVDNAKSGCPIGNISHPQEGLEEPKSYLRVYGLRLLIDGFFGAYKPVFDSSVGGWRKGVDDVLYATLMKTKETHNAEWLKTICKTNIKECRKQMTQKLSGN